MSQQREKLRKIFDQAVAAVAPEQAVAKHLVLKDKVLQCGASCYNLSMINKIYVVGAGKGAAPMVIALEKMLGEQISKGIVCVKYRHELPSEKVEILQASHPVPDQAGVEASKKILQLVKQAGKKDLIIALFTGGASALTPCFAPGISLDAVQNLTNQLLFCSASIDEINTIRKHISIFSGGQLAVAAAPAQVLSLIVSDVIGDDLSVIASGPTSPDPSSYSDAQAILSKYDLQPAREIEEHLQRGSMGQIMETPGQDHPVFQNVHNQLIATNHQAISAACEEAGKLGYQPIFLGDNMMGEAREKAAELIEQARQQRSKCCLVMGGETTVTLRGNGLGGRNQEMALAASLLLSKDENIHCLFSGTDGNDGPTDAAGGFACPLTLQAAIEKNVNGQTYLANNDAYHFLGRTDSLLKTGPTRTNVMDIALLLVE